MNEPPEVDRSVGVETYATPTPPCSATLRSMDGDFQVEEVLRRAPLLADGAEGSFPLYRVEKRSIDTLHLERELSRILKSRLSYAGIKDKRAVAVQYVSTTTAKAARPKLVERPNFRAELVGFLPRPMSRSLVACNRFRITLRGCCPTVERNVIEALRVAQRRLLPNFYGLQRFGARTPLTHLVGRAVVRGRFDEAVRVLLALPRLGDDDSTSEARRLMAAGRYQEGAGLLAKGQDMERLAARRMADRPDDFVGALRAVPIAVRRLYTQAYQSYIFNRTLCAAASKGLDISSVEGGDNWGETTEDGMTLTKVHGVREAHSPGAVPLVQLVGYAYRNYGSRFDGCLEEVMAAEGVAARDFYVQPMQELSQEGGFRRPYVSMRGPWYQSTGDVATVGFDLARGEYATTVLREVVKPADPFAAGFD